MNSNSSALASLHLLYSLPHPCLLSSIRPVLTGPPVTPRANLSRFCRSRSSTPLPIFRSSFPLRRTLSQDFDNSVTKVYIRPLLSHCGNAGMCQFDVAQTRRGESAVHGLLTFSRGNLRKPSPAVRISSTPCSISRAAVWASCSRLPVVEEVRRRSFKIFLWRCSSEMSISRLCAPERELCSRCAVRSPPRRLYRSPWLVVSEGESMSASTAFRASSVGVGG